jgi:dephospho-CoA kinase
MKIVVTGNMGCGKSTFVKLMSECLPHYTVFDFDAAVHSLYEDEGIQLKLDEAFGTHIRQEVREQVFADPHKMRQLANITNQKLLLRTLSAAEHENRILDIPLYFEYYARSIKQYTHIDKVICVTASPEIQRARIKVRNGHSDSMIDAILSKQMDPVHKAKLSDVEFINNFSTVDEMRNAVRHFVTQEIL